jgi:FKBP-type peptidyl-prolyl cis-trans isomerase SlpA
MSVVKSDSLVTLHYRISSVEGMDFVSTFDATPATLQLGSNELAASLEHCLEGLCEGERRVFTLEPTQAFGAHNPQLIQRLPRDVLPPDARPELHELIEFPAPDGSRYAGLVRELDAAAVLIDFNHPLAGKRIRFEVNVIGVL